MNYPYEKKMRSILSDNNENVLPFTNKSRLNLRADCKNCFGLCCIALNFSATEGFPIDKKIGQPCCNLEEDFSCTIHRDLWNNGLKGCVAFDCMGAGQKVSQVTFKGKDWRQDSNSMKQMFEVFPIMLQLHQMLWYLSDALMIQLEVIIHGTIKSMFEETEHLSNLDPDTLLKIDMLAHREHVNELLLKTSMIERTKVCEQNKDLGRQKLINRGADLIGKDLRNTNLRGANLRGAYLIAAVLKGVDMSGADLIGADFRDADIRGTDLSKSFFLTQGQINVAIGDINTKLPAWITRPIQWKTLKL